MGRKQSSGACSCRIRSTLVREFLAEFLGTFVLVAFGTASIAQSVLSLRTKGNFFTINWGWGLGVLLGILVSGGVSGGHLNPAVSVAVASIGKFPWWKVPHYLAGQYLGALAASGLVFLVYWDALVWYEHDRSVYRSIPETAGIFATYPSQHLSMAGGVFDQFLGTLLLLLCICAITDSKNMKLDKQMVPVGVGVTVLGIGLSLGHNCGYAVNPARDLAPRLFTMLAGWGPGVFTEYNHWWIVPVIACHAGAVAGAWLYYLAVEVNWPDDDLDDQEKMVGGRRMQHMAHGGDRNGGHPGERNGGHAHYPHQPPENPGYTGTMSRGHSRPHTPDDEKYQPIQKNKMQASGRETPQKHR